MILPAEIKGQNKIRDAKIMSIFVEGQLTTSLIAEKFGISQPRVVQIVKTNAGLVLAEKDWNKVQRLDFIKRQLRRDDVQKMAVSPDKWVDLWRKEFHEENSGTVNLTQNNIHVYAPKKEDAEIESIEDRSINSEYEPKAS